LQGVDYPAVDIVHAVSHAMAPAAVASP